MRRINNKHTTVCVQTSHCWSRYQQHDAYCEHCCYCKMPHYEDIEPLPLTPSEIVTMRNRMMR